MKQQSYITSNLSDEWLVPRSGQSSLQFCKSLMCNDSRASAAGFPAGLHFHQQNRHNLEQNPSSSAGEGFQSILTFKQEAWTSDSKAQTCDLKVLQSKNPEVTSNTWSVQIVFFVGPGFELTDQEAKAGTLRSQEFVDRGLEKPGLPSDYRHSPNSKSPIVRTTREAQSNPLNQGALKTWRESSVSGKCEIFLCKS